MDQGNTVDSIWILKVLSISCPEGGVSGEANGTPLKKTPATSHDLQLMSMG